jgi:hypothetical protein
MSIKNYLWPHKNVSWQGYKKQKKKKSQNKPQSGEVGKNISSKGGDLNIMACLLVIATVL